MLSNKLLIKAIEEEDIVLLDKFITYLRMKHNMTYKEIRNYFKFTANCSAGKFEDLMMQCDNLQEK